MRTEISAQKLKTKSKGPRRMKMKDRSRKKLKEIWNDLLKLRICDVYHIIIIILVSKVLPEIEI